MMGRSPLWSAPLTRPTTTCLAWRALALGLGAALTLAVSPPAAAYVVYRTTGGKPLRWPSSSRPVLRLDDSFGAGGNPQTVSALVRGAWQRWTDLDCGAPDVQSLTRTPCAGEVEDDGINCVYSVADPQAWEFATNQVALTLVHFDNRSGAIFDVDMAFNAAHFTFSTDATCDPDAADLDAVLTHEFGHFFGLDHSEKADATMAPTSGPGDCAKRDLTVDDSAGFCAIYSAPEEAASDGCAGAGPARGSWLAWLVVLFGVAPRAARAVSRRRALAASGGPRD
jgi:hypothetical protein